MFSSRSLRRVSLVALFILAWGLVFPALANIGVGSTNAVWSEICTTQGIKRVQLAAVPGGDAQLHGTQGPIHHDVSHCVLCSVGGSLPGPAVPVLVHGLLLQRPVAVMPTIQAVVPQPVVLLSAPPRAPPVSIV